MKHSPKQYAAALLSALDKKSVAEKKKTLYQFLSLISRRGDSARLGMVMREIEKQYLKGRDLKKVVLESADFVPVKIKKEVEEILGKSIILEEKINPDLLAGIRILVDEELLIDASAEIQIRRLFS